MIIIMIEAPVILRASKNSGLIINLSTSKGPNKRSLLSIQQPAAEEVSPTVVLSTDVSNGNNGTAADERKLQRYKNCTRAAILEFPPDGFSRSQRRHGWVALHILLSCYCFWLLAIVCDDYFVPAMESMCKSK